MQSLFFGYGYAALWFPLPDTLRRTLLDYLIPVDFFSPAFFPVYPGEIIFYFKDTIREFLAYTAGNTTYFAYFSHSFTRFQIIAGYIDYPFSWDIRVERNDISGTGFHTHATA